MRSTPTGYETERLTNNSNLTDVQVCDLDGDGHQDLLLTIDKTKQTTYAFIIFLRNQGDGTFKKSEQGMEGEYTFHEVYSPSIPCSDFLNVPSPWLRRKIMKA